MQELPGITVTVYTIPKLFYPHFMARIVCIRNTRTRFALSRLLQNGFLRYITTMTTALKDMRVGDLSAKQLEEAYERRLVQDGLDSLARGEGIEVTPEYFEKKRARLKAMIALKK